MINSTSGEIYGANTRFSIPRTINEQTYAVPAPDCLTPIAPAYSAFVYNPGSYSAGIAYKGKYRTFVLGFPFESIQGVKERARVMSASPGSLLWQQVIFLNENKRANKRLFHKNA